MTDDVLYRGGSVIVTGSQAQLGGRSYDLSRVETVSLVRPILTKTLGWIVAAAGLIIGLAGYFVWGTFLSPMLGGIALLIAGLVVAATVRESYTVRLNNRGGAPTLLQFTNQAEATQVVAAVGQAVARRRTSQQSDSMEREVGA